jgi:hypothetical protein
MAGRNQLDEVTCRGDALVLLPRRGSSSVGSGDLIEFGSHWVEEGDHDGTL